MTLPQTKTVMVNLTHHLGILKIQGAGAKALLQGQLTCHLDEISPSNSRLGAHCNPQGRVISLFRILQVGDAYLLQMPKELIPIAREALKKYAVFYKNLSLNEATQDYTQLGYISEHSHFEHLPQQINDVVLIENTLIIKISVDRYEIITPIGSHLPSCLEDLPDVQPYVIWHSINLSERLPAIYPETSSQFLPHELRLPDLKAVSFNKGCYTGQEIIARIEYRGKLKKTLKYISVTTLASPQRGKEIYCHGKPCGVIVDCCQLSYNNNTYDLLIVLDSDQESLEALSIDPEQQFKLIARS